MSIAMAGYDWECEEYPEHCTDAPRPIKSFEDYKNFSTIAVESAIDPKVLRAARKLGKAHARRIERLVASKGI